MALEQRKTIWIDVEDLERQTDKSMLFCIAGEETWLPKSELGARKRHLGKIVRLEITEWLAKKRGWL